VTVRQATAQGARGAFACHLEREPVGVDLASTRSAAAATPAASDAARAPFAAFRHRLVAPRREDGLRHDRIAEIYRLSTISGRMRATETWTSAALYGLDSRREGGVDHARG
jgi:hypothetical protein